ncbi:MAG: GntR family transcriptional regulator [Chloroflexi bacterium]|nr:GntR family transcriptional regulator [Chloroflexota bacterium]
MDSNLVDRRDLTEQCYDIIKRHILERQFQPDEKLSVDRLSKWLGVSRTPTKDAINRLAADGLITIRPRVGSFVTPVTLDDVRDVFEIRHLIELYAAKQGIDNVSANVIVKMESWVNEMGACIEGGRYLPDQFDHFLQLDAALHHQIVELVGNGRLLSMYDSLKVNMHIARVYYVKETSNARTGQDEHEQIVQAYANKDLAALRHVLGHHITSVGQHILENLEAVGGVL